jgi:hypothetical protein
MAIDEVLPPLPSHLTPASGGFSDDQSAAETMRRRADDETKRKLVVSTLSGFSETPPTLRPTTVEIAAWHNNTQDVAAEQGIRAQEAARRRGADILSGATAPIPPFASGSVLTVDASVTRGVIPIVPTLYPGELSGSITVHNHITININGVDGREFTAKMDGLLDHLRRSNEISGEVRDKVIAELTAGMAILKSPKPDPNMIDLLLKRPLTFIALTASGAIIAKLATEMLPLLGKLTGMW